MTSTATEDRPTETTVSTDEQAESQAVLPAPVVRRGITEYKWRMLFNLFPGARPDSALMVWDYCKARGLDPMKKPCHIVPMDLKDANGNWTKRDVVMPGIYEYRITAHRTGTYLGHSKPVYGPVQEFAGVKAPEFCEMTFKRWLPDLKREIEFSVQVFFSEVVATNRDGNANARWAKAPRQMLTKCTEAAGLREGWPEEFGGEPTAEESEGRESIVTETLPPPPPPPVRRSEKAPDAASTGVDPVTGELTNELPDEPAATTTKPAGAGPTVGARAAGPAQTRPAPAGSPRKADSKPQAGGGPAVITEHLVITETKYVTPTGADPFYEIRATVTKAGSAPIGMIFVTKDEALYKVAASCEGTDQRFHITWHGGTRQDGTACKVLEKIEAAN